MMTQMSTDDDPRQVVPGRAFLAVDINNIFPIKTGVYAQAYHDISQTGSGVYAPF